MQYNIFINQVKALEWGLNMQQVALFSFLHGCAAWAYSASIDGVTYYSISKQKVCTELPLLTDKPDTVYRLMKELVSRDLLLMTVLGNRTYISITSKGKSWSTSAPIESPENKEVGKKSEEVGKKSEEVGKKSEEVGKKSEEVGKKSELSENQYQITNISNPISGKKTKQKNVLDFSCWPELPEQQVMDDWIAMRKRAKADVSQTVINRFGKELHKAKNFGFSVDHCLTECVTRNWRGFECQWLLNSSGGGVHAAGQLKFSASSSPAKMPHADVVRGQARRAFERLNGENGSGAVYPDGGFISQQG